MLDKTVKVDGKWYDITKSIILAIMCSAIVYFGYNFFKTAEETNQAMIAQIVKLTDSSIGVMNATANKKEFEDLKAELKRENNELLKVIEKQKKDTKELLDEIGVVKSEIKQTRELYQTSTSTYNKPGMEQHHYFYKEVTIKNDDGKDAKIAWVMFYPNKPEAEQWKFGTFPITGQTTVIETENRNGSFNRYAEVTMKDKNEVKIPVKVTEIKWEKLPIKEKSFFWFDPSFALSATVSNNFHAGINVNTMGYGRTKTDLDFRFLTFGLGMYNKDDISLSFEPFSWNLKSILPPVHNIFLGPSVIITENGLNYGVQFSVPF